MSPALLVLVATAQTAPPALAPPVTVVAPGVEIAIAVVAPDAATAVREDLQELLARRDVSARYRRIDAVDRDEVLRPSSEAPCTLACIWVDLGVATPGRAFVYISPTAAEQVVIRSLPMPNGVDEVAREEVSHIVASSVEALQAGRPLPALASSADASVAKTTRAPPSTTSAPPAVPERAGLWISAGLGAGGAHEGASAVALPMAGASVLVGLRRRRWIPALWFVADAFSGDASGESVALRFRGGALAALASAGVSNGGRVAVRLGLGPGLELRETTPALAGDATSGVALDAARLDPTFFVRAAARLEVHLWERVGLFASATCDARVVSERYTVNEDGVTTAVFQPDFLRPSILLGVDAVLAGEGRR